MSEENNIEKDLHSEKIRQELLKNLQEFKRTMTYMSADLPIGILCLPTTTENILIAHGILRVYDLFNVDLTKIKGLGDRRIEYITSRLDQFRSML